MSRSVLRRACGLVLVCFAGFIGGAWGQGGEGGQGSKPLRTALEAFKQKQGLPKVVGGGVVTNIDKHPWQVSLVAAQIPSNSDAHFCGGSIVGARWVLTAAHCVDNGTRGAQIQVLSGTASLEKGGTRKGVTDIKVHREWNSGSKDFDIALVQVESDLDARSIIRGAGGETLTSDRAVVVTGWGALAWRDPTRVVTLREVTVPFVNRDTCNLKASYAGRVTANMFCAGKKEGGVDACQGDSGGPATVMTADGPRLVGIVSWGEGCGFANKYGVYTQAANFSSWIAENTSGAVRW